MSKKVLIHFLLSLCFIKVSFAQNTHRRFHPDTTFNYTYWNAYADKKHYNPAERAEMISGLKFTFLENQHKQFVKDSIKTWGEPSPLVLKGIGQNQINAGPCTNIDFEAGSTFGWTVSSGFHPNATNPAYLPACCPTGGGQAVVLTGAGNDPFGGFPVVFPGGTFSLRLGNAGTGAQADRISQTFFVTPANANFTYRYAVVLNDNGHNAAEQPRFFSEILDSLGNPLNCTTYNVIAGSGLQGYFTSPTNANGAPVIYKPWTSVALDLTPYIGQNVTIRFTVYDCSQGGHFGYVYIDGTCTNFQLTGSATMCPNTATTFCAPPGFSITTWNGPGVVNNPNQCITAILPGVYTCTTYLIPGCPGPVFTRTLINHANPALTFTPVALNACSNQYTFNSTSSISVGIITGYNWNFSGLGVSGLQNPLFNFPGPGNYSVKFRVTSDQNCRDSVTHNVIINPLPVVAFSPPSYCINSPVQFTNTSFVPVVAGVPPGSLISYTWNLGGGVFSNLQNPVNTYTNSGTVNITLSVTSNMGCVAASTGTLGIFPPPVLSFSAAPLCDINGTSFSPSTNTAIASGSIVSYLWNFGDGFTSTLQNPTHIYATPGTYTVSYTGTSNHSCVQTVTNALTISPTPTVSFNTFSINACTPTQFTFANTSTISAGSLSYTWNFGGTNTSTAVNPPSYNFPSVGSYTVRLVGVSAMGCSDTAFQAITIYPFPVVNLVVPASCENALFTCTVTAPTGSVTSYLWDFGDGSPTSGVQNPTHVYNATGNYTINLIVTSNLNCISSFSNVINVWPNPTANFTFFPGDACTPNYTLINTSAVTATVSNIIAANLWNFGGANTSTASSPNYVFPGPGIYTVNLITTTNHNCKDTVTHNVTIYPYPTATISTTNSCRNVASLFNSTTAVSSIPFPGSVISFTWNFGDNNFDFVNGNTSHFYANTGAYPVTFTVMSNVGCVSTTSLSTTIYPVPVVSFSANNVCLGNPVVFTNSSSVAPPGNIIAWKWDFNNDNTTDNVVPLPTYIYPAPGTYTVELHARSSFNCMDSLLHTVTVYPIPTSSFTASNECLRKSTSFVNLSTPGSASITNAAWNYGDGSVIVNNMSPLPHFYQTAGTYIISLTVTNDLNCIHTSSNLVTVYPLPNVNFNFNEACLGRPTQFTSNMTIPGPSSIVQWKWDFQNDGTWDDQVNLNPSFTYTSSGAYNCKLIAITNNQCDSAITRNLVVHANPLANFTSSTICLGRPVTFSNLSGASDGTIVSYSWDFNGDFIPDNISFNPTTTYTTPGNMMVNLIVSTQFGCSDTVSKNTFVNPKPTPIFGAPNKSGCPSLCVNFENTSFISTGSITSMTWDFGDGTTVTGITNPSHCFNSGNYDVELTLVSDSGCISSLDQPSFVNVYPTPVAAFRVVPDEVDEDEPTINVYSNATDAAFTKYYINDGSGYSGPDFEHTFQSIDKTLPMIVQIVKNSNGCSDTTYTVLKIKPSFTIYFPNVFTPNDDGNNDTYQPKGVGILKFNLQIYDRWGERVFETDDIYNQWDGTTKSSRGPIKQDVYVWKAQVVDVFNKNHEYIGHVTLLK